MHIRLQSIFILTFAMLLGACKPSAKIEETTPKFYFATDTIVTAYNDTLMLKGSKKDGIRMDSIAAGDTARLSVQIDGVFHHLTEINFSLSDDAAAELLFTDQAYMDNMFLETSNVAEGKLMLAGEKTRIPFVFQYHAKKASQDISLTITAISQAPGENSTNQIVLKLPISRTPPPEFYFPSDTVYTEQNDTLLVRYLSSAYRMDRITTGDEAFMTIIVHGVRNRLKQLKITPTNLTDATLIYPDKAELDKLFLPTSDYDKGVFEMDSTFTTLQLPFRMRALEANENFGITFEATTDAPHGYGASKFELRTPITAPASETFDTKGSVRTPRTSAGVPGKHSVRAE